VAWELETKTCKPYYMNRHSRIRLAVASRES
jgi:hypothetical protein